MTAASRAAIAEELEAMIEADRRAAALALTALDPGDHGHGELVEALAPARLSRGRVALIALAASPLWTEAASRAIGLRGVFARSELSPLVHRDGTGDAEMFTLASGALPIVLQTLGGRRIDVRAFLPHLGDILVTAQRESGLVVPPVLGRWAELLQWLDVEAPGGLTALQEGDRFLAEVRALCAAGTPGRARDLIEAAAAVARVLGGPLAVAVRIAEHRVESAYRLDRDRRQLDGFVPRADAAAALDRLLADGTPTWALHYLGVGGAGKSTFLRHLAADVAQARGLAVARVDFDYLSPTYPERDPGRLVEALVHELTIHVDRSAQDHWLKSIAERLAAVRASAIDSPPEQPPGSEGWAAAMARPAFQELLALVGSLLDSFDHPVIVLDTCEELMKLAVVGTRVPAVEATFALVEALHDRCAKLRVIFAGRRLLAAGGHGWSANDTALRPALTDRRPYLALHEVRGFDEASARARLATLVPDDRDDREAVVAAILAAAPEDERVGGWSYDGAPPPESTGPHFSPFRTVALGSWVAGEPDLDLARLTGGDVDPYIEHRIVQRMGRLEPMLPVVALLRRFDLPTFAAALGVEPAAARATFTELAAHEWIDVADGDARGPIVTAKPSVAAPLERYLTTARAVAWDEARRRAAPGLAARVGAAAAPITLPSELVDATLRALPSDVAVRTWLAIEASIGDDWATAQRMTESLLGTRASGTDAATLLGAAIRATHASALIHRQPELDVAPLWRQIESTARTAALVEDAAVPTSDPAVDERSIARIAGWLRQRAALGILAANAWQDHLDGDTHVPTLVDLLTSIERWNRTESLRWPVIAAVEAVVEHAERHDHPPRKLRDLLAPMSSYDSMGFGTMLRARIEALALRRAETAATSLIAVTQADGATLPATLLDWLPPAPLLKRLQLEHLRLCFLEPAIFLLKHVVPSSLYDSLDAAALLDDGHHGIAITSYLEARQRANPSLTKVLLIAGTALLMPTPRRYNVRVRFGLDAAVGVLGYDVSDLELPDSLRSQRLRIVCERATFTMNAAQLRGLRATDDARGDRVVMSRARAIVDLDPGGLALLSEEMIDVVDAWSCQVARTRAQLDAVLAAVAPRVPALRVRAESEPRAAAVLVEIVELSQFTATPLEPATDLALLPSVVHPDRIEAAVRLGLRAWAAGTSRHPTSRRQPMSTDQVWIASTPRSDMDDVFEAAPRRAAQLAFAEGQELSLRFPDRSRRLFALARDTFVACEDPPSVEAVDRAIAIEATWPFERGTRYERPRSERLAAWWRRHSGDVVSYALVGLAVVAIVLLVGGAFIATSYGTTLLLEGLTDWRGWVTGLLGPVVGFAVVSLLFRVTNVVDRAGTWRRRRRARRFEASASIHATGRASAGLRLRTRTGEAIAIDAELTRAGAYPVLRGDRGGDDDTLAAILPLVYQVGAVRPERMIWRFHVADSLAAYAWEAVLLGAHPTLLEQLDPVRSVPRMKRADRVDPSGTLVASETMRGALGRGLAGTGVTHVIGRPVRIQGSVVIDLGDERASQELVLLDGLPAPGTPLVILQGDPSTATDRPTDASRLEVEAFRDLAMALVDRGVTRVLVLPATPMSTTRQLVTALAARLRDKHPPWFNDAIALSRIARDLLVRIEDEAHFAAALEITLFEAFERESALP